MIPIRIVTLMENIKRNDNRISQTMRQKIGIDQNYSSEESIDQIWLEIEVHFHLYTQSG